MKRIGMIENVVPLKEVPYTSKDGQPSVLVKMGVLVTTGAQSIYVEFRQETARAVAPKVNKGQTVLVEYDCRAREYADRNGEIRYENALIGRAIQIFGDGAF